MRGGPPRPTREIPMPHVISNEDGTTTITINSDELGPLGEVLGNSVRDLGKALAVVDAPEFRDILTFLKSVAG